jgi:hypothetical protein
VQSGGEPAVRRGIRESVNEDPRTFTRSAAGDTTAHRLSARGEKWKFKEAVT